MLFNGSPQRGVNPSMFLAVAEHPGLKGMIVLGENAARSQPTLAYCRRHARYYREGWDDENPDIPLPAVLEDASMFYIDHDGVRSFGQMFGALNVYTNEEGSFGLPWNAVLEPGGTMMYRYADGSGQPENMGAVLQQLIGTDLNE